MATYVFPYSDFPASGVFSIDQLHREVVTAGILTTAVFRGFTTDGVSEVTTHTDNALTGTEKTNLDNLVAAHVPAAAGDNFKVGESLSESSTTLSSFQEKLSLSFTAPHGGADYLVQWYYELRTDDGAEREAEARVQLDDSTVLAATHSSPAMKDNVVSLLTGLLDPQERMVVPGGGHAKVALTVGSHKVDIDWKRADSAGTAFIANARIAVFRVG